MKKTKLKEVVNCRDCMDTQTCQTCHGFIVDDECEDCGGSGVCPWCYGDNDRPQSRNRTTGVHGAEQGAKK